VFAALWMCRSLIVPGSAPQDRIVSETTTINKKADDLVQVSEINKLAQLEYVIKSDKMSIKADKSTIVSWFKAVNKPSLSNQLKRQNIEQLVDKKNIIFWLDNMAYYSEPNFQIDQQAIAQFVDDA